jgi:hypothetical protein
MSGIPGVEFTNSIVRCVVLQSGMPYPMRAWRARSWSGWWCGATATRSPACGGGRATSPGSTTRCCWSIHSVEGHDDDDSIVTRSSTSMSDHCVTAVCRGVVPLQAALSQCGCVSGADAGGTPSVVRSMPSRRSDQGRTELAVCMAGGAMPNAPQGITPGTISRSAAVHSPESKPVSDHKACT